MRTPFFTSLLLLGHICNAQGTERLTGLESRLLESSGLLVIDGKYWTHEDSDNDSALFQFDPASGKITRTVKVTNAVNLDWEDLAMDDRYVYVGDFGNNHGKRHEMTIYRLALDSLRKEGVEQIPADAITFTYKDKVLPTYPKYAHHWDCEAMIAMSDSLFLFTKNWPHKDTMDQHTFLYALPAQPGEQVAVRLDTLNAQGLVAGAAYDPKTRTLALTGSVYGSYQPFLWTQRDFHGPQFFDGSAQRMELLLGPLGKDGAKQEKRPAQVEAVTWNANGELVITNEVNAAMVDGRPIEAPALWKVLVP